MYRQILLALVVIFMGCDAFYNPYSVSLDEENDVATCRNPTKPCKVRVVLRHFNGTLEDMIETEGCTCPPPSGPCDDDWSHRSRVISRNIVSSTFNITLKMMFCDNQLPQDNCSVTDEALEVVSSLQLPMQIVSYNCRCTDDRPLILHRRWFGTDHLYHHTYVCSEHKATCRARFSQCLVSIHETVFYHCKCPRGLVCRLETSWDAVRGFGYCRPRRVRNRPITA